MVKKTLRMILLIIGILLLLNLAFLLQVSNFNAGLVFLGIVASLFIVYSLAFNKITKTWHILIAIISAIPLCFMLFLAIYGNVDTVVGGEEVIIVLGAAIGGEQVKLPLARRLDKAVECYENCYDTPYSLVTPPAIVVCGGQGPQEDITEALAMERYLIAKGIPAENIIKEEKSTSTYENFVFAKAILNEKFPNGYSCVVITNNFHVFRATQIAKHVGIKATHIGASMPWYTIPQNYLRETVAVIKAWIIPPKVVGE